ncbi:aspartate aminotransferase family protein [Lignipirellula cremea]|uniref:Glutamate-1-semialdehyde 2,1-aminomutase n=1 Tax=Lignipirellula cremea TaxID=2528010 RepID=A0A518DL40_9BACT|nr:aminotransferase class III-fold pyridoxal phosphate-dependent enzyme [Lignipirellula cremea]QDU92550.1 Glutamate-1-semialdehyde 2,1-aminomutase [Lignipirellula cremea]
MKSQKSILPEAPTNGSSDACQQMLERGRRSIAGGDSSTMRVLPYHIPLVADRALGSHVWDVAGREYIDLNMSYGPLLFGHCAPHVIKAVVKQISERGSQLGFPTEITIRAAEKLQQLFPSMELLRFANSGTEACASAVRLARTATGRRKLIMFEGHYHGWSEAVFNRYHAPLSELPAEGFGPAIPGTTGMSSGIDEVIVCQWNDLDALERCLARHGSEVAGVIMEPVMANAGLVLPQEGYLQAVRELTLDHGVLLLFDEVITGLRVAAGGAQERFLVTPDITVVSKAIGGGYPVSAFGASKELMEQIVSGPLFHGGVFSGNAVVMSSTEAVLDAVLADRENIYPALETITARLVGGIDEIMTRHGVPHQAVSCGPLLSIMLTKGEVAPLANYRDVRQHCDFESYIQFQHFMQNAGVYFHPNQFEPMFLSTAHTTDDIDQVLEHVEEGVQTCLVR